jgi:hypothetical protein
MCDRLLKEPSAEQHDPEQHKQYDEPAFRVEKNAKRPKAK